MAIAKRRGVSNATGVVARRKKLCGKFQSRYGTQKRGEDITVGKKERE
jgi:hypothetical protein